MATTYQLTEDLSKDTVHSYSKEKALVDRFRADLAKLVDLLAKDDNKPRLVVFVMS